MNHKDRCSAPICVDCDFKNVIWYPGESVCTKLPLSNLQRKQFRINKEVNKGTYKNVDMAYTGGYLDTHSF